MTLRGARSGDTVKVLRGHTGVVEAISFSADGARLVTASRDYTARIWNMATGGQEHVLEPLMPLRMRRQGRAVQRYALPLSAAAFLSSDGRLVATVGAGEIVMCRDVASGQLVTGGSREVRPPSPTWRSLSHIAPRGRERGGWPHPAVQFTVTAVEDTGQ